MNGRFQNLARTVRTVAVVFPVLLAGGCETFDPPARQASELRRQEDHAILQERLHRLSGQVETLHIEAADLRAQVTALRREQSTTVAAETRALQSRIEDLERKLGESEAARVRDREQILSSVSGRIADVMARSGAGSTRPARGGSGYVYEHVVQPGESLSRIAAAYGVTVKAIQDENRLSSDLIRAGQTLLIPAE